MTAEITPLANIRPIDYSSSIAKDGTELIGNPRTSIRFFTIGGINYAKMLQNLNKQLDRKLQAEEKGRLVAPMFLSLLDIFRLQVIEYINTNNATNINISMELPFFNKPLCKELISQGNNAGASNMLVLPNLISHYVADYSSNSPEELVNMIEKALATTQLAEKFIV
jgi:hypothetical protein